MRQSDGRNQRTFFKERLILFIPQKLRSEGDADEIFWGTFLGSACKIARKKKERLKKHVNNLLHPNIPITSFSHDTYTK